MLTPKNRTPRTLTLLAVALALAGCGDSQPRLERPNIVLVTIDTLRADHLGCYGYFRDTSPNIDAFAKESLGFDQASAAIATTPPDPPSVPPAPHPPQPGLPRHPMPRRHPVGRARAECAVCGEAWGCGGRRRGGGVGEPERKRSST